MKRIAVFVIFTQLLLFTACSGKVDKFNESTLVFEKDGKITNVIVDSFAKDYYTQEGLSAFLNEKVDDFNDNNPDLEDVSISDIIIEDGVARAVILFDNYDVYAKFYGFDTFYGTVNSAYDSGFFLDTTLKSIDSPETINKEAIMQKRDSDIIIVSEPIIVKSPKKIGYASANVEVIDKKNVRISSDSTGLAYILLEK